MDDRFSPSRSLTSQIRLAKATDNAWPQFDARTLEALKKHSFSMDEIYRFVAPDEH